MPIPDDRNPKKQNDDPVDDPMRDPNKPGKGGQNPDQGDEEQREHGGKRQAPSYREPETQKQGQPEKTPGRGGRQSEE